MPPHDPSLQESDPEVEDAWGDIDGDSFFDAPMTSKPAAEPANFDDGGEPDFEGWLNAQAKAKSKPPLPKGLTKPSSLGPARQSAARTTTTGAIGTGPGPKRLANARAKAELAPKKEIDTKPKETGPDDDWGEAWD